MKTVLTSMLLVLTASFTTAQTLPINSVTQTSRTDGFNVTFRYYAPDDDDSFDPIYRAQSEGPKRPNETGKNVINALVPSPGGGGSFYVEVSRSTSFSNKTVVPVLQSSSCSYCYSAYVRNLSGSGAYYWRVRRGSSYSSRRTVYLLPRTPSTPSISSVTNSSMKASWSAAGNASSYIVYIYKNGQSSPVQSKSTASRSYTFSGLLPNTYYYVRVKSRNGSFYSSLSSKRYKYTKPAKPSVSISNVGTTSFRVNWSTSRGANYHKVVVSRNSNLSSPVYSQNKSGSNTTVSGLLAGTRYYVRVTAYNGSGSTASNTISKLTKPSNPSGVSVTPKSTSAKITWNSVPSATNYQIVVTGPNGYSSTKNTSGTNITFTGLTQSSTYTAKVRSQNSSGYSGYSSRNFTTLAPNLTSFSVAHSTGSRYEFTYNHVDGFELQIEASQYSDFRTTYAFTADGSPYYRYLSGDINGVTFKDNIYFRARYHSSRPWVTYGPVLFPPATPTNVDFTRLDPNTIRVTWDGSPRSTSFEVRLGHGGTHGYTVLQTLTTSNEYIDIDISGLTQLWGYFVDVKASNARGTSDISERTNFRIRPNPVNSLEADPDFIYDDRLSLKWGWQDSEVVNQVTNLTTGEVHTAEGRSIRIEDLISNEDYTFEVIAYIFDYNGDRLESDPRTIDVTTMLGTPKNVVVTQIANDPIQIRVEWDPVKDADTYFVHYSPFFSFNTRDGAGTTTTSIVLDEYNWDDLRYNTTYYFRVYAFSGGYSGLESRPNYPVSITTSLPPSAAADTELKVAYKEHTFDLKLGELTINVDEKSSEIKSITVVSQNGEIFNPGIELSGSNAVIQSTQLPKGVYILLIETDKGLERKKIFVD